MGLNLRRLSAYAKHYDDGSFRQKLRGVAKALGRVVLEKLLILFYVLKDRDTPWKSKLIVAGALGYFIMPADLIPDWIPVAGFTDDATAIGAAIAAVAPHIKQEHKELAKKQAARWLGGP